MGTLLPSLPRLHTVAGVVLLGLAPAAVSAPVYQWKDASGQTVYSDQPPPSGTPAEQLQMPAPPSEADAEAARQRTRDMQEQAEQLAEERRQREQRAAEAAKQAGAHPPEPEEEPSQNTDYDPQNYYPDRQPISRPRPPYGDLPARPTHPIVRPGLPSR